MATVVAAGFLSDQAIKEKSIAGQDTEDNIKKTGRLGQDRDNMQRIKVRQIAERICRTKKFKIGFLRIYG